VLSFVSKGLAAALLLAALGQVIRFPARVPTGLLTSNDIDYLGAIRMPTSDTDTTLTSGGLAGRKDGSDTHLFLFGTSAAVDYPDVYELDVTGLTPHPTAASAPRATLVTNWGKVFNGANKRSWDDVGDEQDLSAGPGSLWAGLYWNEDTDLLYAGYHFNYTTINKYGVAAASLDNPTGPVVTRYGPWRLAGEDQHSTSRPGTRAHWFIAHPTTGKMLAGGTQKSGHQFNPWGPSLYGDNDWPISSTPSGEDSTIIDQTGEYLDYQWPGEQATYPYDFFGALVPGGTIQQFKFPSGFTYAYEIYDTQAKRTDPLLNGGISTWSDENSYLYPALWLEGTHKRGVIFVGAIEGAAGTDVEDCVDTAHAWYRNESGGYVVLTSVSGTFADGETITGGTSSTDAVTAGNPVAGSGGTTYVGWTSNPGPDEDFTVGEIITGGTSKATGTVSVFRRHSHCNHLCDCVVCATGPSSTLSTTVMTIMDPDDLNAVKAGTKVDYTVEAASMFSLNASPYSLHLSTFGNQGTGNKVLPGYFDSTTNRLYLLAPAADCTRTGNCNFAEALVHVFEIDDSAPPVPFPVLPLAAGVAVWSLGGLTGRRRAA
jgi:hypothetical protein